LKEKGTIDRHAAAVADDSALSLPADSSGGAAIECWLAMSQLAKAKKRKVGETGTD